jgi:hypothetical protein
MSATAARLRVQQDTAALVREDAGNLYRNTYERTRGNLINAANFVLQAKAARTGRRDRRR